LAAAPKKVTKRTELQTPSRNTYSRPKITVYRNKDFTESLALDPNLGQPKNRTMWKNPLPNASWSVPIGKYHPGGFAFVRKHSIHTGVDLYCPIGQEVALVETGKVVAIEYFTGPEAASPFYNTTMAVLVEGKSGVVLYGEINPRSDLNIGTTLQAGEVIGTVLPVLKKNKGNGTSMLHLELYRKGARKSVWWENGHRQPRQLLNPTELLLEVITTAKPKSS